MTAASPSVVSPALSVRRARSAARGVRVIAASSTPRCSSSAGRRAAPKQSAHMLEHTSSAHAHISSPPGPDGLVRAVESVVSGSRRAAVVGAAVAVALATDVHAAGAKPVNIVIDPESLTSRVCDNPRAAGVPGTATYKAKCVEIVGVARNAGAETVFNADVYGMVKDQANDDVLNSGRVGSIEKLEPGETKFRLEITVGDSQPLPLKLKNFKAAGATGILTGSPNPYDDYTEFDEYGGQR